MRNSKNILFTLGFVLFASLSVSAQDDIPDYDPNIPVDGGISLLFAAGAAWGIKKLKDKK